LTEGSDAANITVLTVLVLGIGIYLAATTVLIAEDGTYYIEYARRIPAGCAKTIKQMRSPPGYPLLIYLAHGPASAFFEAESVRAWILAGQTVSLIGKLMATVALYYLGRSLVGPRAAFWGVLILSILPDSAEYGSDVLSDWPHLAFLAAGLLLLSHGAMSGRAVLFGCAGVVAGLGYLIRPECCQLVLYGTAWLVWGLARRRGQPAATKTLCALVLLLAGFAVTAAPYMLFKGHVFPEQEIGSLPDLSGAGNGPASQAQASDVDIAGRQLAGLASIALPLAKLCETLMYYFVPALVIGLGRFLWKRERSAYQAFLVPAFIAVNLVMLAWQSSARGFLSHRHSLPLVAFTALWIPAGMDSISRLVARIGARWLGVGVPAARRLCFAALFAVGTVVCLPKLLLPIRRDKESYKAVAWWLRANTGEEDLVAVPDTRIGLYAERDYVIYLEDIPPRARYVVGIFEDKGENPIDTQLPGAQEVFSTPGEDRAGVVKVFDVRGYVSEQVTCLGYRFEKAGKGKYTFRFLFEINEALTDDWIIFFHGFVRPEDVPSLPPRRRRYGFDSWDFGPEPPTSAWPVGRPIELTREITASPIRYDLRVGFFTAERGRLGRPLFLGWVDLSKDEGVSGAYLLDAANEPARPATRRPATVSGTSLAGERVD